MTTDRAPQQGDKYIVRFPEGMRDRIAEEAKKAGRSMNAEIVYRLQESLEVVPAERAAARNLLTEAGGLLEEYNRLRQQIEDALSQESALTELFHEVPLLEGKAPRDAKQVRAELPAHLLPSKDTPVTKPKRRLNLGSPKK